MAVKKLKKLKSLYDTDTSSSSSNRNLSTQASNLKTRLEASGVSTDSRNALQKALNLREGSGFLEGLGDVLERASGLASIKAAIANKNESKSLLEKAWEGFTGDLRYTGTDVIDKINPSFREASPTSRFLGGLTLDILLDPATYLTMGATALTKNATKQGLKALGYTDDAARLLNGKSLKEAQKILKGTKTIQQATEIAPDMLNAQRLLSAGKLYRTADTLDTIANPLKLVPMGLKKAGAGTMKTMEKYTPKLADSVKKLGKEISQTFDYGNFLKKNLGDNIYKEIQNQNNVAQFVETAADSAGTEQAKLLNKALQGIKKDPDKAWTLISNIDGSVTKRTFKGLSDDEILKELYSYLQNEVYFKRPTVLDEQSMQTLIKNKGKLMLPVQDFKNADDLETLTNVLKDLVDDPDKVNIMRYKQKGTEKATGYIIDIGVNNAKKLSRLFDTIDDKVIRQTEKTSKALTSYKNNYDEVQEVMSNIRKNQDALVRKENEIAKLGNDITYNRNMTAAEKATAKQIKQIKKAYEKDLKITEKMFADDPQRLAARKKRAGILQAEEIRNAVQGDSLIPVKGGLTKIELENKIARLRSNYIGKEVIADGKTGKIVKNAFGKVGVKFSDDTIKYFKPDAIKSVVDVDEVIKQQKAFKKTYSKVSLEDTLAGLYKERGDLRKDIGRSTENLQRKIEGSYAKSSANAQIAMDNLDALVETQKKVEDLYRTRELIPYEAPRIDMPEIREAAKAQKQFQQINLGLRHHSGVDITDLDKYEAYIPKVLTPEGRAYLSTPSTKGDPFKRLITVATDKLPAQAAMSDIYGGFSPKEVNTMLGFDLFDANPIGANYQMVKNTNRRAYNTTLIKGLFTEANDWTVDITKATAEAKRALLDEGFQYVNSKEVIRKLNLTELLGTSDVAEIRKAIGNKQFMLHKDAIELFERASKMYKQVDSEFYTQLSKYLKTWKGSNLLSFGYHARNFAGAETNMALAGMDLDDVFKYSAQSGMDIAKYNKKLLPKFTQWILNPENAAVLKTGSLDDLTTEFAKVVGDKDAKLFVEMFDAQRNGIWGISTGQHNIVKRAIGEMPKSKVGKVADTVVDANYKLGAATDDMHRLAVYRWAQNPKNYGKIMKVGAENAADFVNYAMFDFKNMSPREQVYFTKIFPFYNFIKNNLVFQFKNMSKNTQSYNIISKAYKNLYSAQKITDDEIQQYVKDQLYIPIRQADGKIKIVKIAPPIQDATNLLQLRNLLGATNPLIQYITDRAYGEDLYTGADLGDRTRNTQELMDIIPYGRAVRTLVSNPLSVLLPVSSTTSEKGRNQNAYAELERLEKLRKQYKQQTGQSLPTLEELGLK